MDGVESEKGEGQAKRGGDEGISVRGSDGGEDTFGIISPGC